MARLKRVLSPEKLLQSHQPQGVQLKAQQVALDQSPRGDLHRDAEVGAARIVARLGGSEDDGRHETAGAKSMGSDISH